MKIIYGIVSGCIYEGGEVHGTLYRDKGEAEKKAMEYAFDMNDEGDSYMYKNDRWVDGSNYIVVTNFQIK
jgi:hypothetical protein